MASDKSGIKGRVIAERFAADGTLLERCDVSNLVTATGDQFYAGRAVLTTGAPAAVTGMKLGTGSATPAKSGAGAAVVTYLSGSNKALDSGYPQASGGVATFKRTYAAGEATSAEPITEVVLVTDAISSDSGSSASNTIARALLSGISAKGAGDTLVITWTHTILGA